MVSSSSRLLSDLFGVRCDLSDSLAAAPDLSFSGFDGAGRTSFLQSLSLLLAGDLRTSSLSYLPTLGLSFTSTRNLFGDLSLLPLAPSSGERERFRGLGECDRDLDLGNPLECILPK